MPNRSIIVVNFTAPELNHLAAGLDREGLLSTYVRPYANKARLWERAIAKLPMASRAYHRTFGRRLLPNDLSTDRVRETTVVADLMRAALMRLPGQIAARSAEHLLWQIPQKIANIGAQYGPGAELTVATSSVAEPAFRNTLGIKVLNYPIAHHRFIQRFIAEEAARVPEFASTLPDWGATPSWHEPRLDAECALADRILVGSSFARDSFISQGIPSEKLMVIPYGANLDRFRPTMDVADESKALRLLFVGQLSQRKGISYLLRAYEKFRGPHTGLTLVGSMYGGDQPFKPYRGLFEHVPHIPQTELVQQYQRADVFVFPTLIEGLGLVVLEAMASGLPVITTPNGPGDIVRDGIDGFVVPIRDPDAIVEKLEYLRANPDRRREMGFNARQRAQEFSWTVYRQRSVEALRSLIKGEPSPLLPEASVCPTS